MTYSAFAGILHQAKTATIAHEAVHQVKKVNMLTKLMAVTFLVLEGSSTAAEALQYICRQEQVRIYTHAPYSHSVLYLNCWVLGFRIVL
jgi:hypothetical protein